MLHKTLMKLIFDKLSLEKERFCLMRSEGVAIDHFSAVHHQIQFQLHRKLEWIHTFGGMANP